jgi:uncharacterized protein
LYHPQTWTQPSNVSREMTVTGNGEIAAEPDYAQIQIEVRTQGKDVSAAQQENAQIMNRVIGSLMALNIPREDIQTANYSISPMYDYIEGRQVFRGYEVQNAITVKIMDISQAGTVIDTAVLNGANQVSAIQFKIEDSANYYRQALRLAIVDAHAKAVAMAETMHVSIQPIPIEIIEESNHAIPFPVFKSVQMSNQEIMTPIEQGTMLINATIRVKFRY